MSASKNWKRGPWEGGERTKALDRSHGPLPPAALTHTTQMATHDLVGGALGGQSTSSLVSTSAESQVNQNYPKKKHSREFQKAHLRFAVHPALCCIQVNEYCEGSPCWGPLGPQRLPSLRPTLEHSTLPILLLYHVATLRTVVSLLNMY